MRRTASQEIYERIKDDIIFLRRKPGEELNMQALSEEFSISRSPIRDALMLLASESLVDMYPQRGCWVSRIDMAKVDIERLLRISLEKCVLENINGRIGATELAAMEYYIALQKEAIKNNDSAAFYSYDDEMHHVYFEATGLDSFWKLWIRETGNYRRIRLLSFKAEGSTDANIEQHEKILEAFRKKDFDSAWRIIDEHILKLDYEKEDIVRLYPEYFIGGRK